MCTTLTCCHRARNMVVWCGQGVSHKISGSNHIFTAKWNRV